MIFSTITSFRETPWSGINGPTGICICKFDCSCSVSQLCPILCHSMNCGPPGSSVRGILQARILQWVATLFSRGSSLPREQT